MGIRLGIAVISTLAAALPMTAVPAASAEDTTTSLTVSWPLSALTVGETASVDGEIEGFPEGTEVALQELDGDDFWVVDHDVPGDDGAFSLAVPTGDAHTATFRVYVHHPEGYDVSSGEHTIDVLDEAAAPDGPQPAPEPNPQEPKPDPGRRPTVVTASVSLSRAKANAPVFLSGKVSGDGARRELSLVQKLPSGWYTLSTTRAKKDGSYRVKVPTRWYNTHRVAVRAAETTTHQGALSPVRTVAVSPGYEPAGSATSWSRVYGGNTRSRFNPCEVIDYRVNPARMPKGALRDVRGALARLSTASGLRFRYVGKSRYVFDSAKRPGRRNRGTELFLAWATPTMVPGLYGSTVGLGGAASTWGSDARGDLLVNTYGQVVVDSTWESKPGFGAGGTLGMLLLHEILHALGAGHVDDPTQMMNSMMTDRAAVLGAGDLAFLRDIGLGSGCTSVDDGYPLAGRRVVTD